MGLLSLTILVLILAISLIEDGATPAVYLPNVYALGFCGVITLICFVYPEIPMIAAEGKLYRTALVTILFFLSLAWHFIRWLLPVAASSH